MSEYVNCEIIKVVEYKLCEGYVFFVVDFVVVEYMNSVGFNFFFMMWAWFMESGGGLVVVNVFEKVKSLLDMIKFIFMFVMSIFVE